MYDSVKNTSGNDVDGIKAIIKTLEESQIRSKNKYIDYLNNELILEDKRYRTVKLCTYKSRELGGVARIEAKEADESIKDLSSYEKIQSAREVIMSITTDNIKEIYLKYLDECELVWKSQDVQYYIEQINNAKLRKELAKVYNEAESCLKKVRLFHCVNEEYEKWFEGTKEGYLVVNGKRYESVEKADNAYIKWIEHAKQYKNYEGEYNALTENGTKDIPEDNKHDIDTIKDDRIVSDTSFSNYKKQMEEEYKRVLATYELEKSSLNARQLYEQDIIIMPGEVKEIMSVCCEKINVKNNPLANETKSDSIQKNSNPLGSSSIIEGEAQAKNPPTSLIDGRTTMGILMRDTGNDKVETVEALMSVVGDDALLLVDELPRTIEFPANFTEDQIMEVLEDLTKNLVDYDIIDY